MTAQLRSYFTLECLSGLVMPWLQSSGMRFYMLSYFHMSEESWSFPCSISQVFVNTMVQEKNFFFILKVKSYTTFYIKSFFEGILTFNNSLPHTDRGCYFSNPSEYLAFHQRYFFIGLCHKSQCHGSFVHTKKLEVHQLSKTMHNCKATKPDCFWDFRKKEKCPELWLDGINLQGNNCISSRYL